MRKRKRDVFRVYVIKFDCVKWPETFFNRVITIMFIFIVNLKPNAICGREILNSIIIVYTKTEIHYTPVWMGYCFSVLGFSRFRGYNILLQLSELHYKSVLTYNKSHFI